VQEVRASIDGLHNASPAAINKLCGQCHRTADTLETGSAHLENDMARFQGAALARSKCFTESRALSCTTCHTSHTDASSNPQHYIDVCLKCHSQSGMEAHPQLPAVTEDAPAVKGKICPVNPVSGCTDCHMPRQTISNLMNASFANHWIKVWKRK
jgi:hypothetical protein